MGGEGLNPHVFQMFAKHHYGPSVTEGRDVTRHRNQSGSQPHLQLRDGDLVVDLLFVSPLVLWDGDVGKRCLKVHNLLHLSLSGAPLAPQQHPQLHHVVQVRHQHLEGVRFILFTVIVRL